MNTKTFCRLVFGILVGVSRVASPCANAATNDISHTLQRGLFEEEANHNFPAAIQAYESIISQVDSNRPLAATAIFRLGEIYRRQGKTNEASAQYERIVREFPDQEELAKLSHERLPASTPTTSPADSAVAAELHGLDNQITALRKLNQADQRILVQQQYPNPVLTSLMQQKAEAEQKQTELNKDFGGEHPDVLKEKAILQTINKQMDDQVAAVLRGLELRRDSLAASASGAGSQPALKDSGNLSGPEAEEIKRIHELIKNSPDLINAPQQGLMQNAASKGELEVVKLLLENGAEVNGPRQGDLTPLHYAAANGHKAIVDFLLAHGAKPNAETSSGVTPLDLALYKGYEAVAKAVLVAGASVKTKIRSDVDYSGDLSYSFKGGQTPLHIIALSGYPGLIPELLKQGLDLNAQDAGGRTALSYAVEKNNEPAVTALLAAGADVNLGASPPLHLACLHDVQGLAEILLAKGADPNLEAPVGSSAVYSPVEIAVKKNHPELLALLLKNKGNPNQTIQGIPLVFNAVAEPALLKLLLEAGAKPDVRGGRGFSPLDEAVRKNGLLAAELLIAHGSPPTAALFSAVRESGTNIVELLIKHQADVNARDSYEETPLHLTVRSLAIANAKVLLAHQADPNLRNTDGETPLDIAKAMAANGSPTARPGFIAINRNSEDVRSAAGELVKLLREHGARDDLPRLDRIEVTRPSSAYSRIAFTKGTNDWNQFTLLELIAAHYYLISTQPSGGSFSKNGTGADVWPHSLDFPDLGNLVIHRPLPDAKGWKTIQVNVSEILSAGDCARDVWLQWGDVVEVPESDHPIAERWSGMPDATVSNLLNCVSRQITIRLKGSDNMVKLASEYRWTGDLSESAGMTHLYTRSSASFMLRSVLDQMKLIRFSSDLTRVKITRRDATTGKSQEWVIDCSNSDHPPSFWLRDGDVVEIPDK